MTRRAAAGLALALFGCAGVGSDFSQLPSAPLAMGPQAEQSFDLDRPLREARSRVASAPPQSCSEHWYSSSASPAQDTEGARRAASAA